MKKLLLVFVLMVALPAFSAEVLKQPEDFIAESFGKNPPEPKIFKIEKTHKKKMGKILKRRVYVSEIKYWIDGDKSVWVLEEIGKTKPITTGLVVSGDKIESVQVLVYRESHGYEVKYPFFTDQFKEVALDEDNRLDKDIDGISGATLSVNALKKLAALALYLHKTVKENNG